MMKVKILKFLAFLTLLPVSTGINALALTQIELNSHLNQPLNARINLHAAVESEIASLALDIKGSEEGWHQYHNFELEVLRDDAGYYIQITSKGVIREPILNFSVEAVWSTGHIVREYSLLIDPQ